MVRGLGHKTRTHTRTTHTYAHTTCAGTHAHVPAPPSPRSRQSDRWATMSPPSRGLRPTVAGCPGAASRQSWSGTRQPPLLQHVYCSAGTQAAHGAPKAAQAFTQVGTVTDAWAHAPTHGTARHAPITHHGPRHATTADQHRNWNAPRARWTLQGSPVGPTQVPGLRGTATGFHCHQSANTRQTRIGPCQRVFRPSVFASPRRRPAPNRCPHG